MATLTVQSISGLNAAVTWNAANAGGDDFVNDGRTILLVKNASGGSINVTVASGQQVDGLDIEDPVVAVAAGATQRIGPFRKTYYNDGDGKVSLTYSDVTSLTVALLSY